MQLDLTGKVVVITGATKGIGRAIAEAFASEKAYLTIVSRSQTDCERVAKELMEAHEGCKVLPLSADISSMYDIDRIISTTISHYGKLDAIVNNAGSAITGPAFSATEKEWDHVMNIDCKAVYFLCQKAGLYMKDHGGGKIINIASAAGIVGMRGLAPYSAAKGGVVQMTKTFALEWAKHNIQVNAVCPGYVRTPMNDEIIDNKAVVDSIVKKIPMRRFGNPEEIAGLCVFLATEGSNYITGQAICVDGGMVAE